MNDCPIAYIQRFEDDNYSDSYGEESSTSNRIKMRLKEFRYHHFVSLVSFVASLCLLFIVAEHHHSPPWTRIILLPFSQARMKTALIQVKYYLL